MKILECVVKHLIVRSLNSLAIWFTSPVGAEESSKQILFTNVKIFDGRRIPEKYLQYAGGEISDQADAYADIPVVDGNLWEDLSVLGANPKSFDAEPRDRGFETVRVIMKDGKIHKNTLQ